MAFAKNHIAGVGEAIRLSQMTHSWVDGGSGWSEARNRLEHEIGMFLMADKFGQGTAWFIGEMNEFRGFWINDRQNGNMWNALLGRGGTAFEWKDLGNNASGLTKWRSYHGIPVSDLPEVGSSQWHVIR